MKGFFELTPLQGSETERRGSCWEERKRVAFPQQGFIDLPSRQRDDFVPERKQKTIELVARPCSRTPWPRPRGGTPGPRQGPPNPSCQTNSAKHCNCTFNSRLSFLDRSKKLKDEKSEHLNITQLGSTVCFLDW